LYLFSFKIRTSVISNHYEATIGRFDPPAAGEGMKKWIDPKMRKSTEFPAWLDDPDTKARLRGKQVMMYCTGGIRCERASALLKYRMETDPSVVELGIKGVYQLQGESRMCTMSAPSWLLSDS